MYKDRGKYLASQRRYNEKHRKERIELARKWRKENPERARENNRKYAMSYYYKPENIQKRKARVAVKCAVRSSKLKRLPCIKCGNLKSEAHHHDYTKPLDVVWLCKAHHAETHRIFTH